MGKGVFQFISTYNGTSMSNLCQFDVRITCRENRYRIQIYNVMRRFADGGEIDVIPFCKETLMQAIISPIDAKINALLMISKESTARTLIVFNGDLIVFFNIKSNIAE